MRRSVFSFLVAAFIIVGVVAVLFHLHGFELARSGRVARIVNAPSAIYLGLTVRYDKPPIYEERWRMQDVNGISTSQYRITGYSGKVVTITAPPDKVYTVSFFFGRLVQDGIWKITNRPPRGNTSVHYTVYVKQVVQKQTGSRTVTFTDPHWWAVNAGRQYQITLSKNQPVPNLLKLQSTTLADPRYEKIVTAFRSFGPPSFRRKVQQARALVEASH